MPQMDGSGPRGQGPMTGRGMGRCGRGRGFNATSSATTLKNLEAREILLNKELENIKADKETLGTKK